jgi:1-acyl-sn-glycerol-3-phosphate acyltransferase
VSNRDTSSEEQSAAAGSKRTDGALPQWIINLMRPLIGVGSRAAWGLELKGVENIPLDGGLIIAANHQSYGDPFWVAQPVERGLRMARGRKSYHAVGVLAASH